MIEETSCIKLARALPLGKEKKIKGRRRPINVLADSELVSK